MGGDPDAALEAEGISKGRAFEIGNVKTRGQLFERLEIVVLADVQFEVASLVADDRIVDVDVVAGEIDLELVAEAAGHLALDAEARTTGLAAPSFGAARLIGDVHEAGIVLQATARLEAPAVGGGDFGSTLEGDPGAVARIGCGGLRLGSSFGSPGGKRTRFRDRGIAFGLLGFELGFERFDSRAHCGHVGAHLGELGRGGSRILRHGGGGHGRDGDRGGGRKQVFHGKSRLFACRVRDPAMTGKLHIYDTRDLRCGQAAPRADPHRPRIREGSWPVMKLQHWRHVKPMISLWILQRNRHVPALVPRLDTRIVCVASNSSERGGFQP